MADPNSSVPFFLCGTLLMAEQFRTFEWSSTPLGSASTWSPTLQSMVQLLIASRQPMFLVWGEQRTYLYNDAMIPIMGSKHPAGFAAPMHEVWSEALSAISPLIVRAFEGDAIHQTGVPFRSTVAASSRTAISTFHIHP
ncbi:MAG: sensory box histidine kinase/response regulator [Devosia sp.]|nr:sensory box histidine kinase/response regulator [Devosia sp.]